MRTFTRVLILLGLFSCSSHSERNNDGPNFRKNENELVLKASLKACYTNFNNPRDRNYYYLVETKLINNSNKEFEFYTLTCSSLVNIITDSNQVGFLYHICTSDLAALVTLKPKQVYSLDVILYRNRTLANFNPKIMFGFILYTQKKNSFGSNSALTNHQIISNLKLMREKQENVIWSDPIVLTATNFNSYEISNIPND